MYDMDGLAMYDDGMGAYITPEMLKQHLTAAAAGAGGILVASKVVNYLGDMWIRDQDGASAEQIAKNAKNRTYVKGASSVVLGVLAGRMLYDRNRDAAMGLVGGVAGGGLASLLAYVVGAPAPTTEMPVPSPFLSTNLAALEAAVASSEQAFGLSGPTVTARSLSAAGVTSETLAEYAPYLS
jgi:hypothetical protein